MSEKEKVKESTIELMMPLESAAGKYSNYLRVSHTVGEFILDFYIQDGSQNAINVGRIMISPVNFKNFIKAMQTNATRYETTFALELPEHPNEYASNGIKKKQDEN